MTDEIPEDEMTELEREIITRRIKNMDEDDLINVKEAIGRIDAMTEDEGDTDD